MPYPVLGSPKWTAIYRAANNGHKQEVVITSVSKPPPTRVLRFPGVARLTYTAVSITPLNEPEGGFTDMSDELEGLEGLDEDLDELEAEEPESEEDAGEEEQEEKPKRKRSSSKSKKGSTKKKSGGGNKNGPPRRELPKGKHGTAKIAELAGVDERAVRIFLRKKDIKKTEGRYEFTLAGAKKIASAIKKARS